MPVAKPLVTSKTVQLYVVKEIAARHEIDWRTVLKALDGLPIRGTVARAKAEKAAAEVRNKSAKKPEKGNA